MTSFVCEACGRGASGLGVERKGWQLNHWTGGATVPTNYAPHWPRTGRCWPKPQPQWVAVLPPAHVPGPDARAPGLRYFGETCPYPILALSLPYPYPIPTLSLPGLGIRTELRGDCFSLFGLFSEIVSFGFWPGISLSAKGCPRA